MVAAYRNARKLAARVGVDLVLNTFYSPLPDVELLTAREFQRVSDLAGLAMRLDRQLAFVRAELAAHLAEFRPPRRASGRDEYVVENPSYGLTDAAVLHAMVRHLRPARVVELGSGHSTLVAAAAGLANAVEGQPLRLDVYDPYPVAGLSSVPGVTSLTPLGARDVPLSIFAELTENDVLFVDTTHTVKIGNDVTRIVLDILPVVKPGVVVHFHDIFLPYEYPRHWVEDLGLYWSEQYLLQAFLAFNPHFEIVCAVAALGRERPTELRDVLPPGAVPQDGSAMWIRRVAVPEGTAESII